MKRVSRKAHGGAKGASYQAIRKIFMRHFRNFMRKHVPFNQTILPFPLCNECKRMFFCPANQTNKQPTVSPTPF